MLLHIPQQLPMQHGSLRGHFSRVLISSEENTFSFISNLPFWVTLVSHLQVLLGFTVN